ncbi:CBS domain-containing protein [Sphingobacterium psychroaquaticum]|uniref:CBS domain-containing protein n=1 Tax=Sphingobacterium psychroaquaticum TaxID=561061 RepID=A0A1X7JL24_9SPHI|nr:CBS domain-containing protein [Sphingobacterium psychroaquaticum]SMG28025.1 CBS domain-containing protein [Sphingobacterium psychroaquaticum]
MYIAEAHTQVDYELKTTDSISYALNKMSELHTHQLPVVDQHSFLGIIQEEQLLDAIDEDASLASLSMHFRFLYLYGDQHIYDALQFMTAHHLDILPVLDKDNHYVGILTANSLLPQLNETLGNNEPGAIIVLELGKNDVSFSHIAHLIESENTRIISTAVREIADSTKVEMTIKVNKQNIASLVASLWRFDYTVTATFNDGNPDTDIKERYDILMNYLNL